MKWYNVCSDKKFGLWVKCTKCYKWRKDFEFEEEHEVPKDWNCSMNKSGTKISGIQNNTLKTEISSFNIKLFIIRSHYFTCK